ncbi:MAG: AAA family ATPase [Desulfobacteraceae bacterium]|nr:AAA family ATPase [Desulfobacteraceae bacterium]
MKCPKCQFENREEAKFCKDCGNKLEHVCPQCGNAYTPGTKFCDECGHNFIAPSEPSPRDLSFDEKIDKIQRYLPKGLTEKILSQRGKIEGERKQVTVMFCDMEGFTPLVEKLGAEDAYGIMDQIYEILIHKVHDYEGTVNEMTGDGIMALFGAPIALEDAPQRAIRSAMAVHLEMTKFSDKIKEEKKGIPPLKMRIGVHTGPVVVGTLGNDLRVEFKAVGDTVNLASRMEGLAEPGTSYVTEETFKLTEGFFRFEGLGEREVKGREELVNVYRVIAPSTRRTRFDVSAEQGLTPFIARRRELELLLDGFERAKGGRGQAFSIVSEAGIGKSRLLYEFRKAVSNEDTSFLEGKCLSYSRGVAYHPVIDILKANFDIRDGDGDSEVKEKVKRGLKVLGVDEAPTLPYVLELLSVKDSGIDNIQMSPEGKKDQIIEALKRIVLKGSEMRPLIMAFEDLHWIDKSSEDVLKYLLESISGARVFLIFTYRPEFVHTWGGRSYHSQANLNRLSNRESLAMVTHLLGTEEIDNDLEELILEKTEGVPFFIEEFIRSFKGLKIIEKKNNKYHLARDIEEVAIPSTVQDVIMAKVDSLPEGAKEVLQTGSVIEREFSYDLIKQVPELSETELLAHLSALKASELLYERGIFPQTTYIFKHALTREVVYESILTTRRKNLHEKTGYAIEDLYKGNLYEHYEILTEHYSAAENYHKAAEYSELSAKKASKTGSVNDAIAFALKTVVCLEKLPRAEGLERSIIAARTVLGLYYAQLNQFLEAKEAIDPIIDLTKKHDLKRREARIYNILGSYYSAVEGEHIKGIEYCKQAIRISEEINDILSFAQGNFWAGCFFSLICQFDQASRCFEKALSISVAANSLWGISVTKSNWTYFVHCFQGNFDRAYETSAEAVTLAEKSADIFSQSWAYVAYGVSCYGKGLLDEAFKYLCKGTDCCEKINAFSCNSIAQHHLAAVHFAKKEYEASAYCFSRSIKLAENARLYPSWINTLKIGLAMVKIMSNDKDVNLELLRDYAHGVKTELQKGWTFRYMAQILSNIGSEHLFEAKNWINEAIEADRRNGVMFHLGQDYTLYAELFRRKDDRSKAKENLNKAIEIFKECGADGWVEKYEKELASVS